MLLGQVSGRRAVDSATSPCNYAVTSAPNGEEMTAYCAGHLQIVPGLTEPARFELGTGIAVTPVLQERAAALLRRVAHRPYLRRPPRRPVTAPGRGIARSAGDYEGEQ